MTLAKDLRDLFVPNRCLHCKCIIPNQRLFLCLPCDHQLEFTSYFEEHNNPLEKIFYGKVDVSSAASLYFYYKKTPIQTLIKSLKYFDLQTFGEFSGKSVLNELKKTKRFKDIDIVIPVPLHPKKEKERGYNQVEVFAKVIAENIKAKYLKDALIKIKYSKSQTSLNQEDRNSNVSNLFTANPQYNFNQKHVLIVDDILTTGATMISCIKAIKALNNVNISLITIAYAI